MIAIVDYNMGNVQSVLNAFVLLGEEAKITRNKEDIESAKAVVLPGVGAFGDAMANLRKFSLVDILNREVLEKKKPFLGICLGLQLLAEEGREMGVFPGLGWVKGKTVKIQPQDPNLKIPHMGWNNLEIRNFGGLYKDIEQGATCYFVHSYHLEPSDASVITATAPYGQDITASIEKDNIYGVQFHPEKSQGAGLKVLENFLSIC
ncbi:MAG: imidazole glycerol phosphate synthase subunit HisH [Candidatus Wildermuthbacteria bacterium]|nr:imidazole glycerol phosphate synthase subunit HisH [Candidatus Wildermuthbacteria bacterium]